MAFLAHFNFDCDRRFLKNIYYINYKTIYFKLIQNNSRKYSDVLLTIISPKNRKKINEAYLTASELLSALAWQNNSTIQLWYSGGVGIPDDFKLRSANCKVFDFHRIPLHSLTPRSHIFIIPEIENDNQRNALILYRQANSSNNIYISFLFYWHILNLDDSIKPKEWIDNTYSNNIGKNHPIQFDINRLPIKSKSLGEYLYDDCRCAIAHFRRNSKRKTKIKLDNSEDIQRINISINIVKEFTCIYIREHLALNKRMFLARYRGSGFPTFIREKDFNNIEYSQAYQ